MEKIMSATLISQMKFYKRKMMYGYYFILVEKTAESNVCDNRGKLNFDWSFSFCGDWCEMIRHICMEAG